MWEVAAHDLCARAFESDPCSIRKERRGDLLFNLAHFAVRLGFCADRPCTDAATQLLLQSDDAAAKDADTSRRRSGSASATRAHAPLSPHASCIRSTSGSAF
ncbi:MAG: hypothetical protein CMO44_17400 [Verrucomicrobiales bacterium]|nr:hypothetical protein [Verrucomicrobiales bacterium]